MSAAENQAVFLSYASQDAAAVARIAEALRAAGVEVWFDQNELVGGDAWDAKIRKQIAECALFVPVISANTQARGEGYFRLEWKLAVDRSHLMAHDQPFLLPVVIDATTDAAARVPPEFRAVQWTRLRQGFGGPARPEGEDPALAKFCARVQKLLGGEVAQASSLPSAQASGSKPALRPTRGTRRWFLPVTIVAGLLAMGGILALRPGLQTGAAAPTPTAEKPAAAAAPTSEARKLVAQARALFDEGDDSNHENFFLADDLLKKALTIDSTDGEVWAAQAELSSDLVMRSYDRSATRLQVLRTQAERAVKLAPASAEAQLAYAAYLTVASFLSPDGERFASEALDVMQKLKLSAVQQRRALRNQLMALVVLGRLDEGVAAIERESSTTGSDPSLLAFAAGQFLFAGRYAEAEKAIARSLALRPLGRARMQDVILKMTWQGDLDGAAASLAQWPSWLMLEDRGAFLASQVWLWRREPDKAIAVLAPVGRDFLNDSTFVGPKAVLVALAQEMAGNGQAARAAWEEAKRVATRVASEQLADQRTLVWKAVAMARLGETAEAETIFRQLEQTKVLRSEFWSNAAPSALLRIALGHGNEVVAKFDQELRSNSVRTPAPTPRAALRFNPVFDSIRATSEFQKWMAAAPAPELKVASEPPAVVDQKSVAVLAFANLSDDKANEYFSDGISEELLNVLAKVPGLKVTARTSSFHFKGKDTPIPEIARQLGVAYVVEGSVRKAGNQVRITAQLIKAADGFHAWSDTFTRDLKDIFAVQDEIAALIAKNLSVQMGFSATPAAAVNPEALRFYFEARQLWNLRSEESLAKMESLLTRALELEPRLAQAEAGLAQVWVGRAFISTTAARHLETELTKAMTHADKAVALDPASAEGFEAKGTTALMRGDFATAETELARAAALNPNYGPAANKWGWLLWRRGRLDEGLEKVARARSIDPLAWNFVDNHALGLLHLRRYAEAIALFAEARALPVCAPVSWSNGAVAMLLAGRRDDALALARSVVRGEVKGSWNPGLRDWADGLAAWVLAEIGATEEARTVCERLLAGSEPRRFTAGLALWALGRETEGAAVLARMPQQIVSYLWLLCQRHEALANDPRFQQLLGELNATADFQIARESLARRSKEAAAR